MPIHIRHHDKNDATTQQLEISLVIPEETSCSQMSYSAIKAVLGVLY
jgi:nanoRNase/pAp phosphatase (c-di-AMP/oligoRNAs hydrolase)